MKAHECHRHVKVGIQKCGDGAILSSQGVFKSMCGILDTGMSEKCIMSMKSLSKEIQCACILVFMCPTQRNKRKGHALLLELKLDCPVAVIKVHPLTVLEWNRES